MKHLNSIGVLLVSAIVAAPAFAENCALTTFSALASSSCAGSFIGNINGSPSEVIFLNKTFKGPFTYAGKSNDPGNGPFTTNPTVPVNGTLTFDSAISGTFVIGLKAATKYSYYFFDALTPVNSVTFSSTAGVAQNRFGVPQSLLHAALYRGTPVSPVPEPETYALMLGGIGVLAFVGRRRRNSMLKAT